MILMGLFNNKSEIVSGHINELKTILNMSPQKDSYVFSVREKICNLCPLKTKNSCNHTKWINPGTKEIKDYQEEGFVRGCGCRLSAKQKSKNSNCPADFWGGEFS